MLAIAVLVLIWFAMQMATARDVGLGRPVMRQVDARSSRTPEPTTKTSVQERLARSPSLASSPAAAHGVAAAGTTSSSPAMHAGATDPLTRARSPSAPAGLRITATSWHEVDLSWAPGAGAHDYRVYRFVAGRRHGHLVGDTPLPFFDDASARPSTTYTYMVTAVDGGQKESVASAVSVATGQPVSTPIEHVVIVDQENHTFDDVLGRLCAEIHAGVVPRAMGCDGATSGTTASGATIPLSEQADLVSNVAHSVAAQRKAIDGGKMDGFDTIPGCSAQINYACYAQYDPSQLPNLTRLATDFAISDRTFQSSTSPSWGGHLELVSSTLDGFSGANPRPSTRTSRVGPGWGCDSFNDTPWWSGLAWLSVPSCVPDAWGNGPYRSSPVPYVPTILDRLDSAGRSWRIYAGEAGSRDGGSGWGWAICPSYFECLASAQRNDLVDSHRVISDARAGRLPAFSIVTPTSERSQHNHYSMAAGDNWIGRVLGAIQAGPDWSSTAVFITYDDCGCFYDHVPPPDPSLGLRMPMVIVSPYAKRGYTDSNVASFASMLAFTEHTFGLTPLAATDANAYDFAGSFDFSRARLGPVRMTRSTIAPAERRFIRNHPAPADDPT